MYNSPQIKPVMTNYKLIIGGIIAYMLLILYGGIVVYIIQLVIKCSGNAACDKVELHDGLIYILNTVGGLVSALVVSKMAITEPGSDPAVFNHFYEGQPYVINIIVSIRV